MSRAIGVPFRSIARATAALPAAGAWDAAPTVIVTAESETVTLYANYTRGGAAGAADLQFDVSPYVATADVPAGAAEWATMTQYTAGVLAAGVDTQSRIQREYLTYQATAAGAETFVYGPVTIGGGVERMRVRARESGNVGAPGTLQIMAVLV